MWTMISCNLQCFRGFFLVESAEIPDDGTPISRTGTHNTRNYIFLAAICLLESLDEAPRIHILSMFATVR